MNLCRAPIASLLLCLVIVASAPWPARKEPRVVQSNALQTTPARIPLTPDPRYAQFVYDVVSIKPFHAEPAPNAKFWFGVRETADGLVAHCPAMFIVFQAFRYEQAGIDPPNGWVRDDNYEIQAKMDSQVFAALQKLATIDQKLAREHMLQVMLQDRFKFTFHTEPREVNGLDLVVAKNGPKLKESTMTAGEEEPVSHGMGVQFLNGATEWDGRATRVTSMLGQLNYELGLVVQDKTGLTGTYDFTLRFTSNRGDPEAEAPPLDAAPVLRTALEEQLGLRLVPSKTTRDFIVFDHIERPSGN